MTFPGLRAGDSIHTDETRASLDGLSFGDVPHRTIPCSCFISVYRRLHEPRIVGYLQQNSYIVGSSPTTCIRECGGNGKRGCPYDPTITTVFM
jgi:hypothetical protein